MGGRIITGKMMPVAPMGALPRYVCMGITIWILYNEVQGKAYGPSMAALAVLALSFAAKLCMSFGFRASGKDSADNLSYANAASAQLNVAEYEDLFVAIFLF